MELLFSIFEIFQQNYLLILAFFAVAILYSSVGFGGGTSYAALLSLTNIPFVQFRAISLLCNITVVSNGSYIYAKNKLYNWKKVLPLVLFSVPFAFLGGFIKIEKRIFYLILGISLLIAAILMFISKYVVQKKGSETVTKFSYFKNALFGGGIGFFSGMVGVGGGVFLAPLLHLTKWDSPKRIAATSSFFILVNSIAGLIGQFQNPDFTINIPLVICLIFAVFLGGQIGSKLSLKIDPKLIKIITAILIGFVGFRILWIWV